jgi:hypothetical protein
MLQEVEEQSLQDGQQTSLISQHFHNICLYITEVLMNEKKRTSESVKISFAEAKGVHSQYCEYIIRRRGWCISYSLVMKGVKKAPIKVEVYARDISVEAEGEIYPLFETKGVENILRRRVKPL